MYELSGSDDLEDFGSETVRLLEEILVGSREGGRFQGKGMERCSLFPNEAEGHFGDEWTGYLLVDSLDVKRCLGNAGGRKKKARLT